MIEPRRAWVRPHGLSPITGQPLLLEDLVGEMVRAQRRPIRILGGPGSGKTTALRHLAAMLGNSDSVQISPDIMFLDEPETKEEIVLQAEHKPVVFATHNAPSKNDDWPTLRIAPWEEDDWIEYCLACHPAECVGILARLRAAGDTADLEGIPELWSLTLDFLAENPASIPIVEALRAAFLEKVGDPLLARAAAECGLAHVLQDSKRIQSLAKKLVRSDLLLLLRHIPMQHLLAVDAIAGDLLAAADCNYLETMLPRSVVQQLAEKIRHLPKAQARLKVFTKKVAPDRRAMAVSVFQQLDRKWLNRLPAKELKSALCLPKAYLDHANWPRIQLAGATFSMADLSFANLEGTCLADAIVWHAILHEVVLIHADLSRLAADAADFSRANLTGAKAVGGKFLGALFQQAILDEASFHRADLQEADFSAASLIKASFTETLLQDAILTDADCTGANFSRAKFHEADFRESRIDGACFHDADLARCNFEDLSVVGADFSEADLVGTFFTSSTMPKANFAGADLRETGLAEIEWEGANLRDADLRGASFHLGSSRSGLVGSPIAREGSMTGFYTDDFTEQGFKAPEEIRKANLRGADLRGANIEGVDFYLVDLRDAIYDSEQAAHLRACGAILHGK
jgi:uncharacterized protein YjbI with pentapeptide repeats